MLYKKFSITLRTNKNTRAFLISTLASLLKRANGQGYNRRGQTVITVFPRLGPTAAGRPPPSAPGRADEDDDEVADEMGEDEDEEMR